MSPQHDVHQRSLRVEQQQFVALNAELAKSWPSITRTHEPLPDAEEWKDVRDKLKHLER